MLIPRFIEATLAPSGSAERGMTICEYDRLLGRWCSRCNYVAGLISRENAIGTITEKSVGVGRVEISALKGSVARAWGVRIGNVERAGVFFLFVWSPLLVECPVGRSGVGRGIAV